MSYPNADRRLSALVFIDFDQPRYPLDHRAVKPGCNDAILERYMENDESIEGIIAAGFARAVVERVARLIKINEYKRRQAPVGIRVTHRSFGKDWRYPITSKFIA